MPLRREEISNTARNQTLNGFLVFSKSVPDVRLVWWSQSAHSNRKPPRSAHTRLLPQRAHNRLAAPARLNPIGAAGFLRRKPTVELDRRRREIPPQIILVAC